MIVRCTDFCCVSLTLSTVYMKLFNVLLVPLVFFLQFFNLFHRASVLIPSFFIEHRSFNTATNPYFAESTLTKHNDSNWAYELPSHCV